MRDWESAIEKAIREAQERGEFDNLANVGKPLDLEPNPYAPDLDLVHHLLKQQGYAPAWIEEDKEIRQDHAEITAQVQQAWQRYLDRRLGRWLLPPVRCQQEQHSATLAWAAARQRFTDRVTALNEQIRLFNLKVPIVDKQRAEPIRTANSANWASIPPWQLMTNRRYLTLLMPQPPAPRASVAGCRRPCTA
ncbi:MAG: DUF1992 domain-containing protein [Anaerolineae bacterium]|nr:MAG: DUF1992 domain-containing protein [Anaerolineae bacterium]